MTISVDTLITRFWAQMDDVALPHFWSADRVCELLDEARDEFVRETRLFKGSNDDVAVTADDPWVTLPTGVIEFKRGSISGRTAPLVFRNRNEMDAFVTDDYGTSSGFDWMSATGVPAVIVLDMDTTRGRLVPVPTADATITLFYDHLSTGTLTPSTSKTGLNDDRYDRSLLLFAKAKAFEDEDEDTHDQKKADMFFGRFYDVVDGFASELKRKRRRPGTVKYGGYGQ